MNLAIADIRALAHAFGTLYRSGGTDLLDRYSETRLRRIWKVQRFSWWMPPMLHRFPDDNAFDECGQMTELADVTSSRAAATIIAENHVGLPMEWTA